MEQRLDSQFSVGGYVALPHQPIDQYGPKRQGFVARLRADKQPSLAPGRITASPLLQKLSGRQIDQVRQHFTQVDLPAKRRIMVEGSIGRDFALLLNGYVEVERGSEAVNELSRDDFFGEVSLLPELTHSDGVRNASVTTLSPVSIAVCSWQEFRDLTHLSDGVREEIEQAALSRA